MKQLDVNDNQDEDSLNIDLTKYRAVPEAPRPALIAPGQVQPADARVMAHVGVSVSELERSATYIQEDFYPLCVASHSDDLELLPLADALAEYDWLRKKYYWKAVPTNQDQYTAQASAIPDPQGYFIRVKEGAKIPYPVQACLYMTRMM